MRPKTWDDVIPIADWVSYYGEIYFAYNGYSPDRIHLHYCATAALCDSLIMKDISYQYSRRKCKPCHLTNNKNDNFFQ